MAMNNINNPFDMESNLVKKRTNTENTSEKHNMGHKITITSYSQNKTFLVIK